VLHWRDHVWAVMWCLHRSWGVGATCACALVHAPVRLMPPCLGASCLVPSVYVLHCLSYHYQLSQALLYYTVLYSTWNLCTTFALAVCCRLYCLLVLPVGGAEILQII
jgi:hypothetical protein